MTKRIFRTIFIVAVSVLLASVLLLMPVLYDYFSGIRQNHLRIQTELAAQGVRNEGMNYLLGLNIENFRITWIGTDGRVLYDSVSNAGEMENHFEREEVKEALSEGYGESSRYSSTLTERYLYSARRLPDGTVVRLSVAQLSLIVLTLGMLQPMGIILTAAIALSLFLAYRLSKNIVKPLNELNLDSPLENDEYDELSPLLRRIESQQREIRQQCSELEQQQKEFEVLTASMAEGLILLNRKGIILNLNRAAARLLGARPACVGEDILSVSRTLALTHLLTEAQKGRHAEAVMDFDSGRYEVKASPVTEDGIVSGIVLLLLDVTEKEKAEQVRREFTANVSHELKTPLHTISGSAELMANGMVKAEDTVDFSNRIYAEAQRMIRLVDDIIRLSRLDEGAADMNRESVDLYALAEEAIHSLSEQAREAHVTLSLHGEPSPVNGIPQLLSGILYNLCDNAIKYNRAGGSVFVDVKNEESEISLSVADTGIGIPARYQERVFERFFRVDKSHSREIGGTGLGLSIVKHAAKLHHAEIELLSTPESGTVIRVRFPKESNA